MAGVRDIEMVSPDDLLAMLRGLIDEHRVVMGALGLTPDNRPPEALAAVAALRERIAVLELAVAAARHVIESGNAERQVLRSEWERLNTSHAALGSAVRNALRLLTSSFPHRRDTVCEVLRTALRATGEEPSEVHTLEAPGSTPGPATNGGVDAP